MLFLSQREWGYREKKHILVVSLVVVLALVAVYISIHAFYYSYYNVKNFKKSVEKLYIKETWSIQHKKLAEDEYFKVGSYKIKNDFQNFEKVGNLNKDSADIYIQKSSTGILKTSIWFSKGLKESVKYLNENMTIFGSTNIEIKDVLDLIEQKNIKSDMNLLKYVIEFKDNKLTIFSSIKKMKESAVITVLINTLLKNDEFILLTRDYEGYVYYMNDYHAKRVVNIFKNGKKYELMFVNTDYFTDAYIKELLNTLVIE